MSPRIDGYGGAGGSAHQHPVPLPPPPAEPLVLTPRRTRAPARRHPWRDYKAVSDTREPDAVRRRRNGGAA